MKFRILSNGNLYRAQVRTFLVWWDLDGDGYRYILEPYTFGLKVSAGAAIRKFIEMRERQVADRGPWKTERF